jgi:hypothetical protein
MGFPFTKTVDAPEAIESGPARDDGPMGHDPVSESPTLAAPAIINPPNLN